MAKSKKVLIRFKPAGLSRENTILKIKRIDAKLKRLGGGVERSKKKKGSTDPAPFAKDTEAGCYTVSVPNERLAQLALNLLNRAKFHVMPEPAAAN